jgi:LCP family protein required for cell wall assembly
VSAGLRRSWTERAVLAVNTVGIMAALLAAWALNTGEEVASSINRVELSGSLTPVDIDDDGERAAFNVLLVGYDSAANLDPDDPVAIGRQGERLGDVIIVARIDQAAETATLLSIPRDLWVSIPGFGDNKINAAFQLGGPALLIDTIEDHLAIPINSFVSVDLAGFEGLVDVVDHVDLYFEHPARDFNPNPPAGPPRSMTGFAVEDTGCQPLDPETALAFVRSRNFQVLVDGEWIDDGQRSDLERIRRQQLFLESFIDRAIDLGARNPLVLRELVTSAVPHVTLDQDLTPQTLIDLGRTFERFEAQELETFSLPTEFGFEQNRTVSVVRTLDDEAAPILGLMRGLPAEDPSTVGVDLVTVEDRIGEAEVLFGSLLETGFDVEAPVEAAILAPGISVTFGRDGAQAADLLLRALTSDGVEVASVVQDDAVPGREVVVAFGSRAGEPEPEPTTPTTETLSTAETPSTGEDSVPTAFLDVVGGPSVRACP